MARRRIVLGMDGSTGSEAATRWCAENAHLLDAEVVAVHAIPHMLTAIEPGVAAGVPVAYDPEVRADLTALVEDWCAPLRDAGVPYRTDLTDGGVAGRLMEIADEIDAAMIVVGRRGKGGFAELMLGSVPHQLSHHCRRPVLIVTASHK
jgi:nucleotide-binding universal stress UspA family protein